MHKLMKRQGVYFFSVLTAFNMGIQLPEDDQLPANYPNKAASSIIATPNSPYFYTGPLEGSILTDLASRYLGVEKVPGIIAINPETVLHSMWQEKLLRAKKNAWVKAFYEEKVKKYSFDETEKMPLEEYLNRAEKHIESLKLSIDWGLVQKIKADDWKKQQENTRRRLLERYLDSTKVRYLSDIASQINVRHIKATFMTELLPSKDGILNYNITDFMTQGYGPKFISLIPAMYDTCLSFGGSQFTSFALFDNGIEQRQASLINLALPDSMQIPKSVYDLDGFDHFKATYLLAVNSFADLLGSMNKKQMSRFEKHWKEKNILEDENVVKYMILSHHAPSLAMKITTKWIDRNFKGDLESYLNKHRRSNRRLISYMQRGVENYYALLDMQKQYNERQREFNILRAY